MAEHAGNLEDAVVESLRALPTDKQQEVLDFVQFLHQRTIASHPRRGVKGLWTGTTITDSDIAAVRREMWSGFPREDV